MPPPITNCIFCSGAPTTKEHVFPAWSHRIPTIKKRKGKFGRLTGTLSLSERIEKISKGRGDIHDWQVKCVCEKRCNNGWMRRLENKVIPILTPVIAGKPCKLSVQNQRLIAGWATLKAIIGEYDDPPGTWDEAARGRLMRLQLPPAKGCRIWIGNYPRGNWPTHWLTHPFLFLAGKANRGRLGETATEFNSATTTYVLGNLFVHIFHTPGIKYLQGIEFAESVAHKIPRIWPLTGNHIAWPPDPISDREAEGISGAVFRHINAAARAALARRANH